MGVVVRSVLVMVCCLGVGFAHAVPDAEQALRGPLLDQIRSEQRIVLAHRESSIPFSYLAPGGRPVGYALEICERLAVAIQKRLQLPTLNITYLMVTPGNRIEVIEKAQAHLECGSTTNNAARREKVAFTVPHFITGARLLVRADSAIDRVDHPDLRRLVSTRNTTPLNAVRRLAKGQALNIEILEAEDHQKAVDMVEKGTADAFAMDDVLLFGLAANRPNPQALKVVGRFLTTEPLAIMMPKGDPAFKKIVDSEMRRMVYDHETHAIYARWFEQAIPPSNRPLNMPMSYLLRDFWKYPTDQVP